MEMSQPSHDYHSILITRSITGVSLGKKESKCSHSHTQPFSRGWEENFKFQHRNGELKRDPGIEKNSLIACLTLMHEELIKGTFLHCMLLIKDKDRWADFHFLVG